MLIPWEDLSKLRAFEDTEKIMPPKRKEALERERAIAEAIARNARRYRALQEALDNCCELPPPFRIKEPPEPTESTDLP